MASVPPWQWLTPLLGPAHSREVVEGCDSLAPGTLFRSRLCSSQGPLTLAP